MKRLWVLLFLTGCMVGPDYAPPENQVGDAWASPEEVFISERDPARAWWKVFADPLLETLIEKAASSNLDILVAEANILKARAMRASAASKLFPQVSADLNATKTYFSKNGPVFAIGTAAGNTTDTSSSTTGLPFTVQVPQIQNLFNALFDASWEIDLFGKTRRATEAAQARYEGAIEQRNDVLISTLAEVARQYMELRGFQTQAILLERIVQLYVKQVEIARISHQLGLATALDVSGIESQLDEARSLLPNTWAEIYRAIYTLSVLTGQLPEALVDELFLEKPLPKAPDRVAVGLRSDLLRRRPDVRYAERELAAWTADVGFAVASFFPTFTLNADGGLQSLQLPQLFEWGSKTWAYGGDFNIPIFQGWRLFGNLNLSQAAQTAAAHTYQQAVLTAIEDAESALLLFERQRDASLAKREAAAKRELFFQLTKEQHLKGLVNQISLLESEREWLAAKLNVLDSDTQVLIKLIALYKALGGGWQPEEKEEGV